ncbi:MAG TPA: NDP-sugar synthase [Methanomassiliicoccales archaeon]|nr:NDP-sugar synthase [Methanomassiliicoccales archaeon]
MSEIRQAVIMAGGEGTRLRPLTNTRPKPLLPVLGRPCIEHTVRSMVEAGVEEIFLALGYRSQDIVDALGDGKDLGARIVYAYEEVPMGTVGAVKLLEDRLDRTFLVGSGDTLTDANIADLVRFHNERGAIATMGLTEVEHPEQFGIVGTSTDGRIERFKEKPRPEEVFSNVINAGTYVLDKKVLDFVPAETKYDFSKNLFPDLLAKGKPLYARKLGGYWKDIGRPMDLLEANLCMAERTGEPTFIPGMITEGNIVAQTVNGFGGEIIGPAYLGDGVSIEPGARVGSSCIGDGSSIGEGAMVEGSLLLGGCQVAPGAIIMSSILGQGCRIGPGVSLQGSVLGDGVSLEGPSSIIDKVIPQP